MIIVMVPRSFGGTLLISVSVLPDSPPSPPLHIPPQVSPPPFFALPSAVPILPPTPASPYKINNVTIDTPTVCTAPYKVGASVPSGTTFPLIFSSPSSGTLALLQTGSVVSMQLVLANGDITTYAARVSIVQTGATTLATITILTTL